MFDQPRNPLPITLYPRALVKRLIDLVHEILPDSVNRRIFARIVRRQTGLLDPQLLPDYLHDISLSGCSMGTLVLYISVALLFGETWKAPVVFAMAMMPYYFAGMVLSQGAHWLCGASRPPGRIAEILSRIRQVSQDELP